MRVRLRTTGTSLRTTSNSTALGLVGDWQAATWWHRPANASQSVGCVAYFGAPMLLIYVMRHEKGTLHEKRVSSR